MKSPKKLYWIAVVAGVLALGTAATRVKGDSDSSGLRKFQADGIVALTTPTSLGGTIKGGEIGTATISDAGYGGSIAAFTGNGPDFCVAGGGVITITVADGSTLDMVRSGLDCAISGPGLTDAASGNHAYVVTGGTGRFVGAMGGGNYVFAINNGVVTIHIDGNIQTTSKRD